MQVLRQMPIHHHKIPENPASCGKTIYACEKVREVIKEHEQTIAPSIAPKHKSKVVVLGDSNVGKTSIIYKHRFGSSFTSSNATIGASFVSCDVNTEQKETVRIQVWDTAGQERFRCMVPMYMRNADAALIVYDVTCRDSFENISRWIKELERSCGTDHTQIFLVGNKIDLAEKREVTEVEGKAKAARINAKYFEISSNEPNLFSQLLSEVADDVLTSREKLKYIEDSNEKKDHIYLKEEPRLELNEKSKKKSSKCCSLL